jgi:hypothetical protein
VAQLGPYESGELRPNTCSASEQILDRADELGMVVILGIFTLARIIACTMKPLSRAPVENTLDWLFERDYRECAD